jgi:hypothetical protein
MITKRDDIVYHQRTIPSVLAIALFLLYGSNFICKYSFLGVFLVKGFSNQAAGADHSFQCVPFLNIVSMTIGEDARSPPPWTKEDDGFHKGK